MTAWIWLPTLLSCVRANESRSEQRLFEMEDHAEDAGAALQAFQRGDLDALREAARGLARNDRVPGLPEAIEPMLAAVREEAHSVSKAASLAEAAPHLATIADRCGGCHETLEIPLSDPEQPDPLQDAWFAVALRSEARWTAAAGKLGVDPGTTGAWSARRATLAGALASVAAAPEPAPEPAAP